MSIGVNRPDGWPQVTTVDYINEGLDLYFVTDRESQKLSNLEADSRISLAIHADDRSDGTVGLVMSGHAHPVSDPDEIRVINAIMSARWPDFSVYCPTSRSLAVVRFRPELICMSTAVDGQSNNMYFSPGEFANDLVDVGDPKQTDAAFRPPDPVTQLSGRT
jgi:nitroimidazol reductase NimA-like FMN-containing flavoprotein (pyridoxamine 5'-phosphate oxidase superfamily)